MRKDDSNEPLRLVLDESSFDMRGLPDTLIEKHLDDLNDCLQELRKKDGHAIACPAMWDAVECFDGCELYQLLSREHPSGIDRDTLLLTYTLLSNCVEWEAPDDIQTSVILDGGELEVALSIAYALEMALVRHGVACLVFPGATRRGFAAVRCSIGEANIFFFSSVDALAQFWRYLFSFENVSEQAFFELAEIAFPELVLHPNLAFGRFDGTYLDLRDRVVQILSGLNDHFAREYVQCHGLPHKIQAAMGSHHIELSPESPQTRTSSKLMRQRERTFDDRIFICEWHAKVEPHRNRIHFSAPDQRLDGKVLIGIFIDHLPT